MLYEVLWSKRTWTELRNEQNKISAVLLPVGSCEQHGHHLPVDTDTFIAYELSLRAALKLRELGFIVYVLPPINYGLSDMWEGNEGTISVDLSSFINYIKSLFKSLLSKGITRIFVINGHAGNTDALKLAARYAVNEVKKGVIYVLNWWDLAKEAISKVSTTPFYHAGEVETSISMYLRQRVLEKNVRSEKIKRKYSEKWHSLDLNKKPIVYRFSFEGIKYDIGAFGSPEKASLMKGKIIVEEFVSKFIELFKDVIEGKF